MVSYGFSRTLPNMHKRQIFGNIYLANILSKISFACSYLYNHLLYQAMIGLSIFQVLHNCHQLVQSQTTCMVLNLYFIIVCNQVCS